jgi:hypothetical protein
MGKATVFLGVDLSDRSLDLSQPAFLRAVKDIRFDRGNPERHGLLGFLRLLQHRFPVFLIVVSVGLHATFCHIFERKARIVFSYLAGTP